ncbi:hypothetical protein IEZ26_08725 [Nocardioides cavernae]|uniref:Uncharacterized protein n=1 Tax=Nocardioides cavernae TaxID=1921566 RepID=A0ABR8N978_9ACTN|nr:hypothetical protein [Nocardioides cavernae]MBD3924701.1 hypothetical protein [Nocardioides cavernae]MBM7514925.1 hypothetical protein [Nocardioides cavernae]
MTGQAAPVIVAASHNPWLSQGDIFSSVLIVRAGVSQAVATQGIARGPALLISHGCAIDKKTNSGRSKLEYLSFLPLQSVAELEEQSAGNLRRSAVDPTLRPFEAFYLGEVPSVGESYVMLTQPFTLPADFFRPELQPFTAEDTGDAEDTRPVPAMGDTRVGQLTEDAVGVFSRKWAIQWTRRDIVLDDEA